MQKTIPTCAMIIGAIVLAVIASAQSVAAAEIKVLTAGAFKQVVLAMTPEFERRTGHRVVVDNDTVGALVKRVDRGEAFDVLIASPGAIDDAVKSGKIVPEGRAQLARVGIGVVVRAGAPRPDIGTVDAFKHALVEAKSVAYIDPAAGGSSGIYLAKLFDRLGIADVVKAKARLVQGGAVAEHVARGEAEIGIHQISEILPVKGVTLVGPLPPDIQNFTVYAAGIGAASANADAARALVAFLAGDEATATLGTKGMQPVR
jgi:molybdate transport system substrate-binding protein